MESRGLIAEDIPNLAMPYKSIVIAGAGLVRLLARTYTNMMNLLEIEEIYSYKLPMYIAKVS